MHGFVILHRPAPSEPGQQAAGVVDQNQQVVQHAPVGPVLVCPGNADVVVIIVNIESLDTIQTVHSVGDKRADPATGSAGPITDPGFFLGRQLPIAGI